MLCSLFLVLYLGEIKVCVVVFLCSGIEKEQFGLVICVTNIKSHSNLNVRQPFCSVTWIEIEKVQFGLVICVTNIKSHNNLNVRQPFCGVT